jgi:biopolymer transport protein ExbD
VRGGGLETGDAAGLETCATMKLPSPVQRKHSRIEIIPLIDIMFFLLASFMMVSLQMDRTQNIRVNLPPASQARAGFQPEMVNIAVDKDGKIWFQKREITLAALALTISNRFHLDTNLPVYISGDSETLEGNMSEVLETVRNAGVQKVAFLVSGNTTNAAAP